MHCPMGDIDVLAGLPVYAGEAEEDGGDERTYDTVRDAAMTAAT